MRELSKFDYSFKYLNDKIFVHKNEKCWLIENENANLLFLRINRLNFRIFKSKKNSQIILKFDNLLVESVARIDYYFQTNSAIKLLSSL